MVPHPGLPTRLCRPTGPGAALAGLQARPRTLRSCAAWLVTPTVAGRLARDKPVISHETIYRFIYAQIARKKDYSWRHYLPRAKAKRGRRCYKGRSPASFITLRRPLAERPSAVADRRTPGHWEADLMVFRNGQAILERHSRLLIAARPPGKAAAPIAQAMHALLAPLPPTWRQTITFDNGTEFARHYALHALGLETFFCETHSPWQKGGIENAIGRLRRTLPRKTDLATLSEEHFTASSKYIIILRENASAIRHPPRFLGTICCTSNVNPPSCFRRNDSSGELLGIFVSITREIAFSMRHKENTSAYSLNRSQRHLSF